MAEQKYLTVEETSKLLRISVSTLNRLIRQNGILSYKVGRRRLFDKNELIEWIRSQTSKGQDSSESRSSE
jgi:excisionase family DNA binding protein